MPAYSLNRHVRGLLYVTATRRHIWPPIRPTLYLEPPVQRAARIAFLFAAVFALVMAALPHPPPIPGQPSDKLLHMLAFATLGGLSAVGFPSQSVARLFLALTAFGAAIELIQMIPMLNRDSELADLLFDMAAGLAALVTARWAVMSRYLRWPD